MVTIRTVTGDISADVLGICYPHEHLIGQPPAPYAAEDPDLVLDSVEAAVASVRELIAAGGSALVEMTPIDYHRSPAALAEIAAQTGLHIIAVTGFLKEKFSKPHVEPYTVDQLAARFVADIQSGMDGTGIRAGVIKASSSLNIITEHERKVFIAAALAQQETGALISTHTESGTMALEQVALLTAHGVPPERILIGHLDRRLDLTYHEHIADTGVYMGFDQIGKPKYATEAGRIAMIQHLIKRGHLRQIMLSMDIARRSYLSAYGGTGGATEHSKHGFAYLLEKFVPLLQSENISESQINVMLRENPARALARERTP